MKKFHGSKLIEVAQLYLYLCSSLNPTITISLKRYLDLMDIQTYQAQVEDITLVEDPSSGVIVSYLPSLKFIDVDFGRLVKDYRQSRLHD
ncbi:hypothetical protein KSF78_0005610 [Schistosoma japonicum]|nr:hypothetical protein KSF78_0005610 [Schistosoma japonicum]